MTFYNKQCVNVGMLGVVEHRLVEHNTYLIVKRVDNEGGIISPEWITIIFNFGTCVLDLCYNVKIKLYPSCVLFIMLYVSDCWRMRENDSNKLSVVSYQKLKRNHVEDF